MLYTVQDTTMTALGDAVRNKVVGDIELYYNSGWITRIHSDSEDMKSFFHTMDGVSKIKLTINIEGVYNNKFPTIYYGKVKPLSTLNMTELVKNETTFPYEIILDGDKVSLYIQTNPFTKPAIFCYEIVGLDENGNEFKYTPAEMVDEINNLITIPDEALTITGDCAYRFGYGGWDWLIEKYGDKITTKDISNTNYMFYLSRLTDIPFEINLKDNTTIGSSMFGGCYYLKKVPKVNLIITTPKEMDQIFQGCNRIREIPEWFVDYLEQSYVAGKNNSFFSPFDSIFGNCYSLRKIPDRAMKYIAINGNISGNYYTIAYSRPFIYCVCLDELKGISCDNYAFTSNQLGNFFERLSRVKDITFETNEDSTPLIRSWKNQTISLINEIGFLSSTYISQVVSYNSGITADKEVKDDATYQALKDDPDWFTLDVNYSRYNHDSAVNTINSLPDCSGSGGTNTIKFRGNSGALTDGGAINTLTEEEIAVATAKAWTVSLV